MMSKISLFFLMTFIFLYGCRTSGVEIRGYIQTKERVDQDLTGNGGNLLGTQPRENAPIKKTRDIYVLEVSKKIDTNKIEEKLKKENSLKIPNEKPKTEIKFPPIAVVNELKQPSSPEASSPSLAGLTESPSETSFTEYTVKEYDTLQKIAKQFYDSYSKWTMIYEANKDVMKSPDDINPGTVLKIPVKQE